MTSYAKDKQGTLVRLRRLEGQLEGSQRMVEEDRYCVDALNQLPRVIAASRSATAVMLKDHIQGYVRDALCRDERSDQYVNELVTVVERFTK